MEGLHTEKGQVWSGKKTHRSLTFWIQNIWSDYKKQSSNKQVS